MIIRIKNLSKKYGAKVLFEDAQATIHRSEKAALIGQNGTGKTTLVRCISGEEDFCGIIETNGTLSVMQQEKEFENAKQSFTSYLKAKRERLDHRKREIEDSFSDPEIYKDEERYEKIMQEYGALCSQVSGKIAESKLKKMLAAIRFDMIDYEKPICDLSGGQRTKLRLVECLSKDADIYILDEPTNHLDFDTRKWIENYINSSDKTFLIICHDRFFLDRVVSKIVEIENKKLITYKANYSRYLKLRTKHFAELKHKYEAITKEKKRLQKSEDEKRDWAKRSYNHKIKKKADNIARRRENLPEVFDPESFTKKFKLHFRNGPSTNMNVFDAENLSKAFGANVVFEKANFRIRREDRVGLLGGNGSGKSTLLKILSGRLKAEGELKKGTPLKIGYFDQELRDISPKQRVLEFIQEHSASMEDHKILAMLIRFGFPKDKFRDRIVNLSGGEKARLNFIRLMVGGFNVLLLDEPTNNLDLELMEALEDALIKYKGTIVFASHDRYFIRKIATSFFDINEKAIRPRENVGF